MREIIKSCVVSIGIAMILFCIAGIVSDIGNEGSFILENYQFTKMVIGCVLIGLGFGVPSVVYNKENLPMPIKVLIHMGIGCIVFTIVAYFLGWMGASEPVSHNITIVAIQISVSFLIWFIIMRYYRKEAKMLNKRIQELMK